VKTISIIGLGRVGGAFAIALAKEGTPAELLVYNHSEPNRHLLNEVGENVRTLAFSDVGIIKSDLVILAVRDSEIGQVASELAGRVEGGTVVLHTSGALDSSELDVLSGLGCAVGSMHPLIAISDAHSGAGRFSGAFFCVEGDEAALAGAKDVVGRLGGRMSVISREAKPLYHLAAVMAAGHVVALLDSACEVMGLAGIERVVAKDMLAGLAAGAVENIARGSVEEAITGPYVRLDWVTINKHLNAIAGDFPSDIAEIYLQLALRSFEVSGRDEFSSERVKELRERINLALNKARMIL
jgi:predicted short-subunit dehydrogenase-like oxidoreductase (DUF2520 family)